MATMDEVYRRGPPPPDADKVVFIVDAEAIDYEQDKFIVIKKDLELRWPVWYDSKVIRREILAQHPEIKKKLKGRTLYFTLKKWGNIDV